MFWTHRILGIVEKNKKRVKHTEFLNKSWRPDGVAVQDQVSSGPSPGVYQSLAKNTKLVSTILHLGQISKQTKSIQQLKLTVNETSRALNASHANEEH